MSEDRLTNQLDDSTREVANTGEQPTHIAESWMQQLAGAFETYGFSAQASAFNQVFVKRG